MMDLALAGLLNTFEATSVRYPDHFKSNLLERLQFSLTRDITGDGVHVENSPGYHFWVLRFLEKIKPSLQNLDSSLYATAAHAVENAKKYAAVITRFDGSVPTIGDTNAGMRYGASSNDGTTFFRQGNVIVFRDSAHQVWAYFSSGYKTHVHKHCDNGVFNLFYDGKDVLIDPGFLNYEGSADSSLIRSSSFHNTVKPKGEEQEILRANLADPARGYQFNLSASQISGHLDAGKFEAALATIADYKSTTIQRAVIWLKPAVFIVYDKASDESQQLEQLFHIAPSLRPLQRGSVVDLIDQDDYRVCRLSQKTFGDADAPPPTVQQGFYSPAFNQKRSSQRIVFEKQDGYCLSLIVLGEEYNVTDFAADEEKNTIKLKVNGLETLLNLSDLEAQIAVRSSPNQ